jgi:hypothetical protein
MKARRGGSAGFLVVLTLAVGAALAASLLPLAECPDHFVWELLQRFEREPSPPCSRCGGSGRVSWLGRRSERGLSSFVRGR